MGFLEEFGPGARDKEPDRFSEGFSVFIASSALLELWKTGSLRLPGGVVAESVYWLLVGLGVLAVVWLFLGLTDRYARYYE